MHRLLLMLLFLMMMSPSIAATTPAVLIPCSSPSSLLTVNNGTHDHQCSVRLVCATMCNCSTADQIVAGWEQFDTLQKMVDVGFAKISSSSNGALDDAASANTVADAASQLDYGGFLLVSPNGTTVDMKIYDTWLGSRRLGNITIGIAGIGCANLSDFSMVLYVVDAAGSKEAIFNATSAATLKDQEGILQVVLSFNMDNVHHMLLEVKPFRDELRLVEVDANLYNPILGNDFPAISEYVLETTSLYFTVSAILLLLVICGVIIYRWKCRGRSYRNLHHGRKREILMARVSGAFASLQKKARPWEMKSPDEEKYSLVRDGGGGGGRDGIGGASSNIHDIDPEDAAILGLGDDD